jgi:GTPase SAR1 family protein
VFITFPKALFSGVEADLLFSAAQLPWTDILPRFKWYGSLVLIYSLMILTPLFFVQHLGAILVYDITDRNSFVRVQNWVKELRKMLGKDIILVIAGNKMDLEKNRQVTLAEAEQYAKEVGARHFSTSAKLNKGINELFIDLTTSALAFLWPQKQTKKKKTTKTKHHCSGPLQVC